MAETPSTMLSLGTKASDFTLPNTVDDRDVSLSDYADKEAFLVVFTSNHCPFAVLAMPEVVDIANEYAEKGVGVVAISSNNIATHPADAPELMKSLAIEENYPFPYLYDETQEVAKAYTAACTPDFFLFDANRELVYRGQLDDSRPGNGLPTDGKDLRDAIDNILSGDKISEVQKPSLGCNIKWKMGKEPEYY